MRDLFDKIKFSTTAAAASSQPAILSQRENVSQTIPNEIAIRTHSPHINSQIRKLNVLMSCVCVCVSRVLYVAACHQLFFFSSFSTAYSLCHQESSTLFLPAFIFRIYCAIENRIALPAAELRKHIEINAGETTPRAPLSTAQCTRFERIIFLDISSVYVRL